MAYKSTNNAKRRGAARGRQGRPRTITASSIFVDEQFVAHETPRRTVRTMQTLSTVTDFAVEAADPA
ncbi:hypothetical protein JZU48_01100, partial [bacterium]|nr:hypothetical protein [bacterium]